MKLSRAIALPAAVLALVGLVACKGRDATTKSQQKDRAIAARQLGAYQVNQPIPVFTYSQLRQNLIEIETAQAQGVQTTTFFFNQGVQDPVQSCPSIGFAVPTTNQLSNPEAKVPDHDLTLPQIEANGVYTGSSTGTFVMCVDAQGHAYADYWEGFVQTVAGPAKWDAGSHSVQLTGPPSFKFSKGQGK